jgi:PD-(D/E)XK nuclease superfamily protein
MSFPSDAVPAGGLGDGLVHGRYTAAEIDALAAYGPELGPCFYLPIEFVRGRATIYLRLAPARNNQHLGVKWADDFDFEHLHWDELKGP